MTLLIVDGDPLMFRAAYNKHSAEEAYDTFEEKLEDIENTVFCDTTQIAVFGDNNFRIDYFKDYKNTPSRKKSKANNPYYFELRQILMEENRVVPATGMEADDLVRIWAEEAKAREEQFVVASVDKDLQCISGHHYLIHRDELIYVDDDMADKHYWTQILTGDAVDNIRGLRGIGPKKAERILEGAGNSKARKQRVIDAYYEHHGNNWRLEMLHTGTLIHIMRTPDDMFKLKDSDVPSVLRGIKNGENKV
jgi:5'-3' exonuclease